MIEQFFQRVLELKNIPRQGWKEKLEINNPESVADHSYSTSVMSMILSDLDGLDSEKINKENIAMKQILKNLPNKITKQYFELWNEYQKNSSQEAKLLHDVDKLEMAFQAKFYHDKGISKEKLQTFFNTAKVEIKNKNLSNIISNFIE